MFHLSREALLHVRVLQLAPQADSLRLLLRFSSTLSKSRAFRVSYLVNSCGLSPESALSASKLLKFVTPARPDAVIGVFKNRGFTPAQISQIIARFPTLLSLDPDKILSPKFDFLRSRGISDLELTKLVVVVPWILGRSLDSIWYPLFVTLVICYNPMRRPSQPSNVLLDYCMIILKLNLFLKSRL